MLSVKEVAAELTDVEITVQSVETVFGPLAPPVVEYTPWSFITGVVGEPTAVLRIIVFCIPVAASDPLAQVKVTEVANVAPVVKAVAVVGFAKSTAAKGDVYAITSSQ